MGFDEQEASSFEVCLDNRSQQDHGAILGNGLTALGAVASIAASSAQANSTVEKLSEAEAIRFLAQASCGANEADINTVKTAGRAAWIAGQMTLTGPSCVKLMKGHLATEGEKHWDPAKADDKFQSPSWGYWCNAGAWGALALMVNGEDTLRQRIAFTLSQIFVVNSIDGHVRGWGTARMWDIFNTHAFGNFRDLLTDVTLSYRMGHFLTYIDQDCSKKRVDAGVAPDENYARELMQLFTIGLYQLNDDGTIKKRSGKKLETYTQADIIGLAGVFTGLGAADENRQDDFLRATKPMVMRDGNHYPFEKKFLGLTIPAGTSGMVSIRRTLDHLFNQSNVGPFIGKQLIQRLVTSNPSPDYVKRVVSAFNLGSFTAEGKTFGSRKRGDLAATVAAVLLDPEAVALPGKKDNRYKLREPVLRFTQYARLLCCDTRTKRMQPRFLGHWLFSDSIYQIPFWSRSVFNFFRPGFVPPNTLMAKKKMVAPEFQIVDENTVPRYIAFMGNVIRTGFYATGIGNPKTDYRNGQPVRLLQCSEIWKRWVENVKGNEGATLIVDRANALLAAGQLSERTLTTIRNHIYNLPDKTEIQCEDRVKTIVFLVMISPDYLVLK